MDPDDEPQVNTEAANDADEPQPAKPACEWCGQIATVKVMGHWLCPDCAPSEKTV